MPEKIVDLDALTGGPIRVRIRGKWYTLPPDMPVELYLRLTAVENAAEGEATDEIRRMADEILKLFQDPAFGDPSIRALPPIGIKQLLGFLMNVYGEQDLAEAENAPPPRGRPGRRSRPRR